MVSLNELELININKNIFDIKRGYLSLCSMKSLITKDFIHCTSCPYRSVNDVDGMIGVKGCSYIKRIQKVFR